MRLSGCPSLSMKVLDDPLRDDPVAAIDETCVGCGNCGEVADAAVLCPSFYRADVIHNPNRFDALRGCALASPAGCSSGAKQRLVFEARVDMAHHLVVILGRTKREPRTQGSNVAPGFSGLRFAPPENDIAGSCMLAPPARSDHQARDPRGRRAGRRRRQRLDRRSRRAERLVCAVDLGAGRGAAHRRDDLLHRDGAARATARRCSR